MRISGRALSVPSLAAVMAAVLGVFVLVLAYTGHLPGLRDGESVTQRDNKKDESVSIVFPTPIPGGEHHKPMQLSVDFPGVKQPILKDKNSATSNDDSPVIGVLVAGEAYAFEIDALSDPTQHIVNMTIHSKPISVTYCDLVDCVRVLTDESRSDPIDLHIGGLDVDHQMVVLLDGVRYGQSSAALPLQDYPYEKTTLGDWKKRFPKTRFYQGVSPG